MEHTLGVFFSYRMEKVVDYDDSLCLFKKAPPPRPAPSPPASGGAALSPEAARGDRTGMPGPR